MSERVVFTSDGYQIEGMLNRLSYQHAVIITHPHPLYGGDMNNPIVDILDLAYEKAGYTTLKFNFRGVGQSQGVHDGGTGEQQDIISAYRFLVEEGISTVSLAGYSFGAWVNACLTLWGNEFDHLIFVSPPVDFISFQDIQSIPNLLLAVIGDRDDFASVDSVTAEMKRINPSAKLEIIAGADHFYFGHTEQLSSILNSQIPPVSV